jgi:hypothetical protein
MLLSSLLLTPILGVLAILINKDRGVSVGNIKLIALITSILNLFISLVVFILFDFSTNQFQFVQEYHEISYFDFYLGVDGLSIYFILLTTLIIPISLVSNWKSITKDVESYVIIILLLESLLLAVFLVLGLSHFFNTLFTESLDISSYIEMSNFYTGKGKGKASSEDYIDSQSESEKSDLDDSKDINEAIWRSLQQDKVGESSKNIKENPGESYKNIWENRGGESSKNIRERSSSEGDDFEFVAGYTQMWKTLNSRFKTTAKMHNELHINLEDKTTKNASDIKKLTDYKEETKILKAEMSLIEKKLSKFGINPSEQFNYESDTGSEYSSYYSDNSSNKRDYNSDGSQGRSSKRVKYSNNNDNLDFAVVFFSVGLNLTLMNFLSFVVSAVLLLTLECNILPDLYMPLINIRLHELLSLYLVINLIKLTYKWYRTVTTIYNTYLNKEYVIIYFNIYLSIIILLLYLSRYNDVYVLFF